MKKGIVTILLGSIAVWAQAADLKAGEEKAMVCVACHGPGGVSANPDWPSLAGQGQKYIEKQLKDFKSGERPNMVMQPQAGMLSDEDIVNVPPTSPPKPRRRRPPKARATTPKNCSPWAKRFTAVAT